MVDRNTVCRGYDELADEYAASRSEGGMEILDQFLDACSDPVRVLDAGCGQGAPVLSRLSTSTDAVGLDFSGKQLSLAGENAPGTALVQGDMTALPFADDAFDAVVAYFSLIHVPGDAHGTVLGEFARVLEPGGRVLLTEGANAWTGENPDWLDTGVEMQWSIAGAVATREQLSAAGFSIEEEWEAPERLERDDSESNSTSSGGDTSGGAGESADGEEPWVFFSAQLEG